MWRACSHTSGVQWQTSLLQCLLSPFLALPCCSEMQASEPEVSQLALQRCIYCALSNAGSSYARCLRCTVASRLKCILCLP